ncbi:MAG: 30S ribosomal protein S6 [Candidatus Peribacteraceae bacterium]|nr:30S ribosomal protein S6 [Candidatus Peribacteraceae bacterium]MDD5075309.1 30S ribosomal protein S6 [Candidatus Peribacteraceae bacterium]
MPTITPTSEDTVIYELCVLYPANLSQKEEAALLKEIEGFFSEAGGKQIAKDAWGRRGLAYPIKKEIEGNFVIYHYELDPSKLKEIDRQLHILPNLMRHLIVKPPKGYVITKYSEHYVQWLKDRSTAVETEKKEEEKKLQKKMTDRAKVQAKRAEAQKKETKAPAMEKEALSEKLEQIISDKDIGL